MCVLACMYVCLQIPRTIENTRIADETTVRPDDAEVFGDEKDDEFATYYSNEKVCYALICTMPCNSPPSMSVSVTYTLSCSNPRS